LPNKLPQTPMIAFVGNQFDRFRLASDGARVIRPMSCAIHCTRRQGE
jgi:hypothetical protein